VSRVRAGTKRGDVVGVRLFLRGFSLIELVLVTCVLVVPATVALPRYARGNLRARVEAAAQRVSGLKTVTPAGVGRQLLRPRAHKLRKKTLALPASDNLTAYPSYRARPPGRLLR